VFDRPAPVLAAYAVVCGGIAMAAGFFAGWVLPHFLDDPVVTVIKWVIGVGVVVALGWYADVLNSWYERRRRS
jgi:hypothetical protein